MKALPLIAGLLLSGLLAAGLSRWPRVGCWLFHPRPFEPSDYRWSWCPVCARRRIW